MNAHDNATNRYGSAAFVEGPELARAGMFRQESGSLLVGFHGKKPLWHSGPGGVLLIAGARGGKLRDILGYNICSGICRDTMFVLDMKGELAAISQNQTPDDKFCIYWNPLALHGFMQHRINPVDYVRIDSPSLVSDVKVLCQAFIPNSGSPQGVYFENRAREVLEAIILTLTKLNGVLTLPDLSRIVNLIPGNSDEYQNFAFEMTESGFPLAVRIEAEIAASRDDQSNGFQGILGEVFKSLACLSDPVLMNAVSPPFDFSLGDPCEGNRAYQTYFMVPAEFVDAWAPVLKAMFVGAMIYKSRSPQAPRQTWVLDECAQLGKFDIITKLFTYGAGIGIRPLAVFQSADQMKAVSAGAETIIPASASCRIWFAIRDPGSAMMLSSMIGTETLEYADHTAQDRARLERARAAQTLIEGGDMLTAGLLYGRANRAATRLDKQRRLIRTPDEILTMPEDRAVIFADGLSGPVYAHRRAYYDQKFMAGRFFPNPFHPPLDSVRVMTRWGRRTRRIVSETVPHRFARFPQYASGTWSRVDH